MYSPTAHEVGTHVVPLQRQNEMPAGGEALQVRADGVGAAAVVVVTVTVGFAAGGAGWAVSGGCAVVDGGVADRAVVGEAGWRLVRDAALLAL